MFNYFEGGSLICSPRMHLCEQKYSKNVFINFLNITISNIFYLSLHDPLEIFLIFCIQEIFILINAENSFCCLIFNNLDFGNCHTFISVFLMN